MKIYNTLTRKKEDFKPIQENDIGWNRLLVMAVALGLADKDIEQLKVALPEMLKDPQFMPVYAGRTCSWSGI